MDNEYFDNQAIGSSLLAAFIDNPDRATLGVKPSKFMEAGKFDEDFKEEMLTGKSILPDKYFKASCNDFPNGIIEIIEAKDVQKAVKSAYVYNTKPDKKTGKIELNGGKANFHKCLDEIAANGYKRPVPSGIWDSSLKMLENFKKAMFKHTGWEEARNLFNLLTSPNTKTFFQQEFYWTSPGGAKCRMKADIIIFWEVEGRTYALIFDLKVTANWPSFRHNWKKSYIWQGKHYLSGFQMWCEANDVEPPDQMWYLIQESSPPYLLHQKALSKRKLDYMEEQYQTKLVECQAWIDAGKPIKGYTEAETVNEYLKPEEEY